MLSILYRKWCALLSETDPTKSYRTLSLGTALASIAVAPFVAMGMGLTWELSGFGVVALTAGMCLLLGLLIGRIPGAGGLADSLSLFGAWMGSFFACAAIAMMSTRTPLPFADDALLHADSLVGLSAPRFAEMVAAGPTQIIALLEQAYVSSGLILIASLVLLPLIGQKGSAWRCSALIHVTMLVCVLTAFVFPALGAFSQIDPASIAALPSDAGRYAIAAVTKFREADAPLVSTDAIEGVVTFPSFHTIIALLIVQAWAEVRVIGKAMTLVGAVIIVSTLPMGGHYFVDLIAGLGLWWGCSTWLNRLAERSLNHSPHFLPRGQHAYA